MQEKQKAGKLKKVLGVAFGIAVVIGGTIGVGILRTPGSIAALLPNAGFIIACWVLMGLFILLSASSYAELTTMLPKAGGAYNYIKRAFGNYAGFINGWFDFFSNVIAPAYFCITLGDYFALAFPQLHGNETLIAIAFLTLFMLINLPGIKSGSLTQQITSTLKIVLFIALIIGCFVVGPSQGQMPPATASAPLLKAGLLVAFFKAMQLILGTYDGWMSVSFFAEEDDNPGKNIPRSYLIGALTVTILYILINTAILYVLPINTVAHSPLAAADAAAIAFGKWGAFFMTLISIFSLISILNAYIMIPPRILYGLSRDNFFVKKAMTVNKGGTPIYAMLLCYAIAVVLIIFSSFDQLFVLATFMMTIVTGSAFASLIKLRHSEPDLERPYKAWGYPFSTYTALIVNIALFLGFAISDHQNFMICVGILVLSYPCYRLLAKMNKQVGGI